MHQVASPNGQNFRNPNLHISIHRSVKKEIGNGKDEEAWIQKACERKREGKEKHTVVDDDEASFLNFVDQNAKQNAGFSSESSGGAFDSGSDSDSSSSSSSLSGRGGPFGVGGISSSSSDDEPAIDKGMKKSAKKRGRPSKRGKVSKMIKTVKENSMKGVSSLSRKGKELEKPLRDPQYNKKELKASFKVIKKVMEMDEAASFNAPVDPVSQGLPDYFDVIDTPMDFGTICTNLRNCVKYLNAKGVYKDVQCIWENCLKYNKKGDYTVYLMKRVKKKFMKYWRAAGLESQMPRKTNGYSHLLPCNHHAIKHSKRDAISTKNHIVDSQMQQDNYGAMQPQSQVLFSSYSQPYQLHQPQPSSVRPPQVSQLQSSPNVNYLGCQVQQDNFGIILPHSQVLLPSYCQNCQSHQPHPSNNPPPQLSQL